MARGDHLYYYMAGGSYSHHGIDCGNDTVIHYELTPWMKLTGKFQPDQPAVIARTSFDDFSRGNQVMVRDYDEESVDDVETVISRAEQRVGEDAYSVFGNNCEHFVVWCKTGESLSSQVDAHWNASKNVLKGAPLGLFLLRATRKLPARYRGIATLGAIGLAGAVYLATYVKSRVHQMQAGLS